MKGTKAEWTNVAIQAAFKAGGILKNGFSMTSHTTSMKSGIHDLVTSYDKAAEEAIIGHVVEHFPEHAFLAEESGGSVNDTSVLWVIDPLDGTLNFVHHIPLFAVSIAVYAENSLQVGVIYLPMLHELFVAIKGKGAFLNGSKIQVSSTKHLSSALNSIGFPARMDERGNHLNSLINIIQVGAPFRDIGSAAVNLAYLAAGRFDTFWIPQLQPWDVAAGKLLVEEAGGIVSHYDGSSLNIFSESPIAASNGILHAELVNKLSS